jgi:hypothetical protein
MKTFFQLLIMGTALMVVTENVFSQSETPYKEFGIDAGGFTNFPANQNYMTDGMGILYVAPYVRAGRHEFSAGFLYPVKHKGLYFSSDDLDPRLGAIAGYKFYVFDPQGRENLFVHYSFEYVRFQGMPTDVTETDMYINNAIGLGYNVFFDTKARFGLYYLLDYVITQTGYQLDGPGAEGGSWTTRHVWNNLSTHFGLSFKLTEIKKKSPKN